MIRLLIILLFIINTAKAEEIRTFAESPNGLFMGGAFNAIADDEYTLFYNPALLARHKGFSFAPFNPSFGGTNVLKEPDRFNDLGSDPNDFADAAFAFPVNISLGITPGFKLGGFAMAALNNYQTNFNLQNRITPMLDVDHRYDKGFIFGYGRAFSGSYKTGAGGQHWAWGVSAKYIQREGIYGTYNLTGTSLLNALSESDPNSILRALGQVKGSGWGFDLGLDYAKSMGQAEIFASLALLDVYTILHTESNDQDLEVQDQPYRANFGTGLKTKIIKGFDAKFTLDIKYLESQIDFMKRVAIGTELGLTPAISIMAGVNALDNYSYGLKLNTGLIKFYAGFYSKDIGERIQQQDSDRFLIYLSMFHFTFDP